uniref:Late embryogenesis abundant protein LEA-2 subgroup domain-containing protein n=1 Tax=Oryza punctata TaxID=4537 RepID=A0A0E0MAE0_ORYPU
MPTRRRGIAEGGHATRVAVVRCIVAAILAAIVVAGLVALVFWLVVRPKPIEYTVTRAVVRHFNVTPPPAATVNATFYLNLAIDNPNRRISMRYEDSVAIRVLYGEDGTELVLAAGDDVPGFHQPHHNETTLPVRAVARSAPVPDQVARELEHDLAAGELSVDVQVIAGVRFIVGGVASRYYRVHGTCSPVNIGLSPSAARSFNSVPCDVEIS